MRDLEGREYCKMAKVKVGQWIVAGDGFTCIKPGTRKKVFSDRIGLYILCERGRHYLETRLDHRDNLIGLYPEKANV